MYDSPGPIGPGWPGLLPDRYRVLPQDVVVLHIYSEPELLVRDTMPVQYYRHPRGSVGSIEEGLLSGPLVSEKR
jgi:hypothetical protein